MTAPLPDPQEHPMPRRLFDKQSFSVIFTRYMGKNHRIILIFLLVLVLTAMAAGLAVRQSQQSAGLLELVAIISRLPREEQVKPIACSWTPIADGPDKAALQEVVFRLAQPTQRAKAYCLLGDVPSAMAAYAQAASKGDDWSAFQVYFLQARQGDMLAAKQALNSIHFSDKELQAFFTSVINLNLNIDVLPVAQRMAELYPGNPDSWILWRDAGQEYERASNWQSALDAYLEAIQVQNKSGVRIGRSSFELAAGLIFQFRLKPPDLNSAFSYYNAAIADMDFLNAANPSNVYIYRGEVYQGLSPAYTASQALQEFLHSLELDPKNMWAMRAIAGVYL
jgi:tetratricopeptide (TPR) repeat protein